MIVAYGQKVCVGDLVVRDEHVGKIVSIFEKDVYDDSTCGVLWFNHWGVGEQNFSGQILAYYIDDLFAYNEVVRPEVY